MSEPVTTTDEQLLARAGEGDFAAFQQLVSRFQRRVFGLARRIVGQEQDAEDVTQQTFLSLLEHLESFRGESSVATWILKIATNHAIDFLRKRKLPTTSIDQPVKAKDGEIEFELPDITYRPDQHIVEDERKQILQEAIDSLPEKYYTVIVMRHQQEKSYEEIARELDLPLGTVKAHIFRARAMLYRKLRHNRGSL